ncbi:MAG: hypothetical protein ACK41T_01975 [Pseudobdellovibrio sp.]
MVVVRFLERKRVIQCFGGFLILSPFFNIFFQLLLLNSESGIPWQMVNFKAYLLSGSLINYFLATCSVVIGMIMLSGSTQAWKYVLILVGSHVLVQISSYKSKIWHGPLAWIALIINVAIFLFIADQLVWKLKASKINEDENENKNTSTNSSLTLNEDFKRTSTEQHTISAVVRNQESEMKHFSDTAKNPQKLTSDLQKTERILNLTSYKKIFFSFDSDKPWGRLVTLTSHQLIVKCFEKAPDSIEHKVVQIAFTRDLKVDIRFDRKENNMYYFIPLDMTSDRVRDLNQWLKKIAV